MSLRAGSGPASRLVVPDGERSVDGPAGAATVRLLLTSGGDERIWPNPQTGKNRYGVGAGPASGEIWFSSSTASAISESGFRAARAAVERLTGQGADAVGLPRFFDDVRHRIAALYGTPGTSAVLLPSGTEGEFAVLGVARALMPGAITNIVIAPEETGSGVMMAADGRSFLNSTSLGAKMRKGARLAGLSRTKIAVAAIKIRDEAGHPLRLPNVDAQAYDVARKALAAGRNVVLHVLDTSKTGLSGPSRDVAASIQRMAPDRVLVVVDACQLRCSPDQLRSDLAQNFLVLITGSKFAGGPPFCGALLIPHPTVARLAQAKLAFKGLGSFSALLDWPHELRSCVASSLAHDSNLGLGLRWTAALDALERFRPIDRHVCTTIAQRFESETRKRVVQCKATDLLPALVGSSTASTIMPFILLERDGSSASFERATGVHEALRSSKDGHAVHLGQPVALGPFNVLRISASAQHFIDIAERYLASNNLDHAFKEIENDLDVAFDRLQRIVVRGKTCTNLPAGPARPRRPAKGGQRAANLDPENWEEFSKQSHAALDLMIDHLRGIADRPVWREPTAAARAAFLTPLPRASRDFASVLGDFKTNILPFSTGNTHPLFMGWVHGAGTPFGMIGEMLAAGLNANCGGRNHIGINVEQQIVRWATEMFDYPAGASGVFVTGTSMANFLGLLVARDAKLGHAVRHGGLRAAPGQLVVYTSAEAHGCIRQATELSGIGSANLRLIAVDEHQRMNPSALRKAIAVDRREGREPFLVVATAGTVNTGAIDDLDAIASVAEAENLWFHVDGAFGALAALSPKMKPRLKGIERSNSIGFDFHKWAHVPYDAGFLLVRNGVMHKNTFANPVAYLQRAARGLGAGETWPCDLGPDLSRGFRALKTWLTFQSLGADRLGQAIERCCENARYLEKRLRKSELFEPVAPVSLNIVCCRLKNGIRPGIHEDIVMDLHQRGVAAPSLTLLDGRPVIRAAIVNHRTERVHVNKFVDELEATARKLGA